MPQAPSLNPVTQLDLHQLIAMQKQVSDLAVRRKHIRSAMSGAHLSRLRGRGMEFDEVRIYQPGDDVGCIDWKVTARKGNTHVKMYREERERPVLICLDYRKSMFFATRGALKSVVASKAAALLAWHSIAHGDRLGGLLFSDSEHAEIKPTRGRKGVLQFLNRCCQATAWEQPHLQANSIPFHETTRRLRKVCKPGTLIYMLSDFRGLNDTAIADLTQLARHNDVVLISIYDTLERQFPHAGTYPVFDGKSYFNVFSNQKLQQHILQQTQQQLTRIESLKSQHGIHHIEIATHNDVSQSVREQLWAT